MPKTFDLIVRGGDLINHAGRGMADIGVIGGKIAAIGDLSQASAGEVFDATGLTVMPGVIDTQVHFREPGLDWKEDLETGSRGAVLGGVVAVFEMPNTNPTTTDPDALADKLNRAANRMHCDHAFYVGGTHENATFLGELERETGQVVYVNAGHNPAFVARPDGSVQTLNPGGVPLGLLPGATFRLDGFTLGPGDLLCLYSDGVTECAAPDDDEFGLERLIELVQGHQGKPLPEIVDAIDRETTRFARGLPQADDQTVVLIRRCS